MGLTAEAAKPAPYATTDIYGVLVPWVTAGLQDQHNYVVSESILDGIELN